ncbi:MAG: hypothetical protein D6706_18855 [Chloroflexi bacterium]|nr:MAG: hypothetical protein D6706_18855 [Chloroflexota bacterium]
MPPAPPPNLAAVYYNRGGIRPLAFGRIVPQSYVSLSWQPAQAASGVTYNVYRSSSAPVPLDAAHRIASGLRHGALIDTRGCSGDYYVVTSLPPKTVTAKAAPPTQPAPWKIAAGTAGTQAGSLARPGCGAGTLPGRQAAAGQTSPANHTSA